MQATEHVRFSNRQPTPSTGIATPDMVGRGDPLRWIASSPRSSEWQATERLARDTHFTVRSGAMTPFDWSFFTFGLITKEQ